MKSEWPDAIAGPSWSSTRSFSTSFENAFRTDARFAATWTSDWNCRMYAEY